MLYNVTTMAATWNSVATKDIRLLRQQMNVVSSLPKDYVFLNYLRCHDDIGWGLDYPWLKQFGIDEVSHKKYLNDFLTDSIRDLLDGENYTIQTLSQGMQGYAERRRHYADRKSSIREDAGSSLKRR